MKTTYYVWRRSDGYVNASATHRENFQPSNGKDKFEVLLITEDWAEALECIKANRDERHDAVVASWSRGV